MSTANGYITVDLIPSAAGLQAAIQQQLSAMGAAGGSTWKASFLGTFAGNLGAEAFAQVGDAAKSAVTDVLAYNQSMQNASVGFETMLGSASAASDMLTSLVHFANSTPFDTSQVITYSQRLLAMGIDAQDVIPYMTAAGDAAAAMGTGADGIDAITRALGQIKSSGVVHLQDLNQLMQAGIPVIQILADSYGVTTSQLRDMVSAGTLMSDDALPKIVAGLEDGTTSVAGFGGMMDKQSKTVAGAWSNIKDTIVSNIGNAVQPAFDSVGAALGSFSDKLPTIVTDVGAALAKLAPGAQGFATAFENVGRVVATAWPLVSILAQAVGVTLLEAFNILGPVLAWVTGLLADAASWVSRNAEFFGPLVAAVVAYVAVTKAMAIGQTIMAAIEGGTKLWTAAQWLLNVALDANPIGLVIAAIAALVAIVYIVVDKTIGWGQAWKDLQAVGSAVASWFSGPFVRFFTDMGSDISTIVDDVVGFFTAIPDRLTGIGAAVGKALVSGVESIWNDTVGGLGFDGLDIGPVHIPAFHIPYLAKGGITTGPTVAMIGEAGPEAVVPLSKLDDIVTRAIAKAGSAQPARVLNYYAAPGSSISSEEDLFAAANRSRMGW